MTSSWYLNDKAEYILNAQESNKSLFVTYWTKLLVLKPENSWRIMVTPSIGNIFRVTGLCEGNPPITGGFRRFCLICTWTNGWANNIDAGDLRRHRVHYDVTAIWLLPWVMYMYVFCGFKVGFTYCCYHCNAVCEKTAPRRKCYTAFNCWHNSCDCVAR